MFVCDSQCCFQEVALVDNVAHNQSYCWQYAILLAIAYYIIPLLATLLANSTISWICWHCFMISVQGWFWVHVRSGTFLGNHDDLLNVPEHTIFEAFLFRLVRAHTKRDLGTDLNPKWKPLYRVILGSTIKSVLVHAQAILSIWLCNGDLSYVWVGSIRLYKLRYYSINLIN